jgi:hypothetical protein
MTTYYMLTSWPSQVMSEVVKDGGRSPLSHCDEIPPATVAKTGIIHWRRKSVKNRNGVEMEK